MPAQLLEFEEPVGVMLKEVEALSMLPRTGRDVIDIAQTGTGKTAAFMLPLLQRLAIHRGSDIRALILAPTRELAEQIHEVIKELAAGTRLKSVTIYGGVGASPQVQALRGGAEIIVACPGRLLDLIAQGHAKMANIEILVLDEADRMFDMGFLPDVRRIVKAVPTKRQTMMFSATFPPDVELLAQQALKQPQKIAMGISRPAYTVSHALYPVPPHLKSQLLIELLKRTDTNSVLIFTRTKYRAQKVSQQILRAGFKVTSLHGDRSQGQRQSALKGFKSGHHDIMVATDIAARGLDVESISHVINYDMPDTADATGMPTIQIARAANRFSKMLSRTPRHSASSHKGATSARPTKAIHGDPGRLRMLALSAAWAGLTSATRVWLNVLRNTDAGQLTRPTSKHLTPLDASKRRSLSVSVSGWRVSHIKSRVGIRIRPTWSANRASPGPSQGGGGALPGPCVKGKEAITIPTHSRLAQWSKFRLAFILWIPPASRATQKWSRLMWMTRWSSTARRPRVWRPKC